MYTQYNAVRGLLQHCAQLVEYYDPFHEIVFTQDSQVCTICC